MLAVMGEVVVERSGSVMQDDSGPNASSVIISWVSFEGGGGAPVRVELVCGMVLLVGMLKALLVVFDMMDVEGVTVALVLFGKVELMVVDGVAG